MATPGSVYNRLCHIDTQARIEKNRQDLNNMRELETKKKLLKPPVPVMAMTNREMESFGPRFIE